MITKTIFSFFQSTKFQLATIVLSSLYIGGLIFWEYKSNIYKEEIPKLLSLSESDKQLSSTIKIGMHINSFPVFSFNQNNFTIDAIIWFRFPKASEDISILEQFTIQDSIIQNDGNLIHKSQPIIKIIDDDVLVCYYVIASFKSHLSYTHFPISDHRLNIVIQNRAISARELSFETSPTNLTLSKDLFVENWTPREIYGTTGYMQSVLDQHDPTMSLDYPCAVFSINFISLGARNLISLYFPIFVIFFITLLSLFLNIFSLTRLGIIAASLPILVLFRMVIESASPEVGYATHIDFVYNSLVFLSVLILLVQTYISLETEKIKQIPKSDEKNKKTAFLQWINDGSFIGTMILLIILMTINYFR